MSKLKNILLSATLGISLLSCATLDKSYKINHLENVGMLIQNSSLIYEDIFTYTKVGFTVVLEPHIPTPPNIPFAFLTSHSETPVALSFSNNPLTPTVPETEPFICNNCDGLLVPIPTFPESKRVIGCNQFVVR